jgi:hypothetical protein
MAKREEQMRGTTCVNPVQSSSHLLPFILIPVLISCFVK